MQAIKLAGHYEIAEGAAKVLFNSNPASKVQTLWVYGARDSGKSTAIGMIEELLCTQQIQF